MANTDKIQSIFLWLFKCLSGDNTINFNNLTFSGFSKHYIHFTPSGIKIISRLPYHKLESGVNRPQFYFKFAVTMLRPDTNFEKNKKQKNQQTTKRKLYNSVITLNYLSSQCKKKRIKSSASILLISSPVKGEEESNALELFSLKATAPSSDKPVWKFVLLKMSWIQAEMLPLPHTAF